MHVQIQRTYEYILKPPRRLIICPVCFKLIHHRIAEPRLDYIRPVGKLYCNIHLELLYHDSAY